MRAVGIEHIDGGFRSVQRLGVLDGTEMPALAEQYFQWLQRAFRGLVKVRGSTRGETVVMHLLGVPAIRLRRHSCVAEQVVYRVEGGALARSGGEFLFTRAEDAHVVAVLQGFQPRLPGWLYRRTHGPFHASVMRRFCEFMGAA